MSSSYLLTRAAGNPLMTIPVTGESKSQYVPHVCPLPNGDLLGVVKGDDSRAIHAWKSINNGQLFTHQGIVIAPSGGSNWDGFACLEPTITYDAATDTIHYLWKGNPVHASYGGWSIGHGQPDGPHARSA